MTFFKKRRRDAHFFHEDSLDTQFDNMMYWVRDLSRKDYNKVKKAMDNAYESRQILHGIDPIEESDKALEFALHAEEGK